jgi:glutathione S-transferase
MVTVIKPIKLWGRGGPNPPKVAIVLEELNIPHETILQPLSKVKEPEYLAINPNGRIPAIYDPNTDLTLWESGAIIEYLIEKYDPDHKISFPAGSNESHLTKQWLYYQVSGQGPYFGQASWFKKFHTEKVSSAVERYVNEIHRVTGVLEGWLTKQKKQAKAGSDGPWLVGDKYTFADLAFAPWYTVLPIVIKPEDGYTIEKYPVVKNWIARISARAAVKQVFANIQPVQ